MMVNAAHHRTCMRVHVQVPVETSAGLKAGTCNQVVFDHHGLGQMQSCTLFLDSSRGDASWRVDNVDAMAQPFQGGPADVLTFWFCTLLKAWAGEGMASASAESSRHLSAPPRQYMATVKTSGLKGACELQTSRPDTARICIQRRERGATLTGHCPRPLRGKQSSRS